MIAKPLKETRDINTKTLEIVRDGIESLPERVDLSVELPPVAENEADANLEEALIETFPASEPLASGRTA